MSSACLRRAVTADLPGLLALYAHLNPDDPVLTVESVATHWQAILRNPMLHYFVVEQAGTLVSSCCLSIIPNLTRAARPYGLIENVVTHAAHRRQGYATQVLHAARDAAWAAGCYKLMLMTSRQAPAVLDFYQRAGFVIGDKTAFIMRAA